MKSPTVFNLAWMDRLIMEHRWELYSRFLSLMEPHIEETIKIWEEEFGQKLEVIEDSRIRDDFLSIHVDEIHELFELRAILMNSFFSASYALFEHQLVEICETAKEYAGSPFSVDDLKHSPLDRVKQYLTNLGVDLPVDTPEWRQVKMYQEIRNKLMHEGGIISSRWDHFRHCKDIGIIEEDSAPRLVLTQTFCDEALNDFKNFLIDVHQATVDKWEPV